MFLCYWSIPNRAWPQTGSELDEALRVEKKFPCPDHPCCVSYCCKWRVILNLKSHPIEKRASNMNSLAPPPWPLHTKVFASHRDRGAVLLYVCSCTVVRLLILGFCSCMSKFMSFMLVKKRNSKRGGSVSWHLVADCRFIDWNVRSQIHLCFPGFCPSMNRCAVSRAPVYYCLVFLRAWSEGPEWTL